MIVLELSQRKEYSHGGSQRKKEDVQVSRMRCGL